MLGKLDMEVGLVALMLLCVGCAAIVWMGTNDTVAAAIGGDTSGAKCPRGGIVLLGKDGDLSEWLMERDNSKAVWPVKDGVMTVKGGGIITKRKVRDFRMHVEFNVNKGGSGQGGGNSGVYIQQRYEVQILNSFGKKPSSNGCGGLYRFKAPGVNACRPAGEWQTYDIEFHEPRWDDAGKKTRDARITIVQNGELIHDNVAIPNKTGAGKQEGPGAGPIRLQDHGNPVRFRNIWIVPLEK